LGHYALGPLAQDPH